MRSMRTNHSSRVGSVVVALVVCFVALWCSRLWHREPRYQGYQLSYWLEGLRPTMISSNHQTLGWASVKYRSVAAVRTWAEFEKERRQREELASTVIKNAGSECLPILLANLTAPERQRPSVSHRLRTSCRQWTYRWGLTDFIPDRDDGEVEVRRGQALTAIVLLGPRAAPLIPQLSVIAAQEQDNAMTRAASFALFEIAPSEFRRVRSSGFRSKTVLTREETNKAATSPGL